MLADVTQHSQTHSNAELDDSSKTTLPVRRPKKVRFASYRKISDYFSSKTKELAQEESASFSPPWPLYSLQGVPDILRKVTVQNVESCFTGTSDRHLWVCCLADGSILCSGCCIPQSLCKHAVKLIKTYLRSMMMDKWLCSLSMIAIECHIACELDYTALVDEFAIQKADAKVQLT